MARVFLYFPIIYISRKEFRKTRSGRKFTRASDSELPEGEVCCGRDQNRRRKEWEAAVKIEITAARWEESGKRVGMGGHGQDHDRCRLVGGLRYTIQTHGRYLEINRVSDR